MSVVLDVDNRYTLVRNAGRKTLQAIDKATSYPVAGAEFTPAFRARRWDGRQHLFKFNRTLEYHFPTGLLADVLATLSGRREDYRVLTTRKRVPERVPYNWSSLWEMRPYQGSAVKVIKRGRLLRGTGILKLAPRAGKTIIAARLAYELGVAALFIVPDVMLLHQTAKKLRQTLMTEPALIGDGHWSVGPLTVATIQSLAARKKTTAYLGLLDRFGLVVFDECHHLKGDEWHKIMMAFDAPYRVGLSATAYPDLKSENEKGVIWLTACCGPVRVDVTASELIAEGWLICPTINLVRVREPNMMGDRWSGTLVKEAIHKNEYRNGLITRIARKFVKRGLKTLVISNRLVHTRLLSKMLDDTGLVTATLTGSTSTEDRDAHIKRFVEGDVDILIGTVFGEGVDIPEIEAVINAEGGRDMKATMQRLRNLTIADGKTEAVLVDFIDQTNPYLVDHSLDRVRAYRTEPAFKIRVVDAAEAANAA